MDQIQKNLLEEIAGLHEVPAGAYNIRANGGMAGRNTTANIDIVTKEDKQGIDIIIKPGTKKESIHIPVIISESGLTEMVYNDFYIGDDSDVVIVAGLYVIGVIPPPTKSLIRNLLYVFIINTFAWITAVVIF